MCFSVEYKAEHMKMKIPTGGSGNGYYGHESGVIAYLEHGEQGVQAPVANEDFSEYMWMENEEEFDKQVTVFILLIALQDDFESDQSIHYISGNVLKIMFIYRYSNS